MLKIEPLSLYEEIQAAETLRDKFVGSVQEMIREYHGKDYRLDQRPKDPHPENHAFEWLARVTPRIVYDNPTVGVYPRSAKIPKHVRVTLKHGLDRWARDTDLWHDLLLVWMDAAFGFGVIRMGLEDIPGYPGYDGMRPRRPVAVRTPPYRFFIDPRAHEPGNARFMGHTWVRDQEDLLKIPDINKEAVESMTVDADLEHAYPKGLMPYTPKRGEVVGYEVWVPEVQSTDEPGYNGTIYTMGVKVAQAGTSKKAEAKWLRPPRPFYGPKEGPYVLFRIYPVPDQVFPLSPLAASRAQVLELNAHAAALARSASGQKTLVAYDPRYSSNAETIKAADHGSVVPIDGLQDGAVQQITLGGASKDQYDYVEYLHDRRDRLTGLSDVARGQVTGSASATEVAEASEATDDRLGMIKRLYDDCVEDVLYRAGWWLWGDQFATFPLGPEAIPDLAPRPAWMPEERLGDQIAVDMGVDPSLMRRALAWEPDLWFQGGEFPGNYEDLDVRIEARSMERTSQALAQKRAMEWLEIILKVAPAVTQMPHVRWRELLDDIGQAMNQKDAAEYLDLNFLQQQSAMMPGVTGMPGQAMAAPASGIEAPPAMQQAQALGQNAAMARGIF